MSAAAAAGASRPDLKNPDLYVESVPYDIFARLRREEPVFWNPEADGSGFWSVLRQADIVEVSRQPELFSSANKNGGHRIFNEHEVGLTGAGDAAIGVPFISCDPPVHNQYRRLIMPAVAPGRLGDIEKRIERRTEALLDKIPIGQSIDIVAALAAPLPLLTLAELMDVPVEKWTDLYRWANAFVGEDDPDFRQSPEAMQATVGEFFGFTQDLFARRRATPGPDVVSLLANAELEGRPITFAEFVGNMILVLVGGNETTRNAISHAIVEFAAHPDQWDLIRTDPSLLRTAVPEMVRHSSPVMHMRRTATADTAIAGQKIAKGDKVVVWYSSGNRDESVYDEPDRFDVTRKRVQHVGFGTGQHVCVGARLAELELQVVFGLLAPRVARFEVNGAPRRLRSNFINGLKQLNVTLVPAEGLAGVTVLPADSSEGIIADVLGGPPEVGFVPSGESRWRFSRWRHFVGSYALPALPDPLFVVHVGGKPRVRTRERDGWSQASSAPGCATLVPNGRPTGWLVDGELDVVTLSLPRSARDEGVEERFAEMRFAYADSLATALARQILAELYEPTTAERDAYVAALMGALQAHVLRGAPERAADVPTSGFSAYRLHQLVSAILAHPEAAHGLDEMAAHAGVTPSHLCRVFRRATGFTPHQYVLKARLDQAGRMLAQTDAGIATIADHLGFAGQSHFTRAFRRHFGETPGDARRRARERAE